MLKEKSCVHSILLSVCGVVCIHVPREDDWSYIGHLI